MVARALPYWTAGKAASYRLAMDAEHFPDSILIVDFGSQVTQLIARRVREAGVYSEIAPFTMAEEAFHRLRPKGIILSGSPAGVPEEGSPRAPQVLFESGLPILGICYGQQVMTHQLGGEVRPGHETGEGGEFGRAFLTVTEPCSLFDGLWQVGERHQVWMSHGDKVTRFAEGFRIVATSDGAPFAVIADDARKYYGTQFHPEVYHTPDGAKLLANFVRHVCGLAGDWTMAEFRKTKIEEIRAQVGDGKVICVTGIARDKDIEACMKHLAEKADGAIFTTYYNPRESKPIELLRLYEKFGGKQGSVEDHPEAALEEAIEQAGEDGLVLVTGSVYLAGLLRQAARDYAGD